MVLHVVLVTPKDDAEPTSIEELERAIVALGALIPGIADVRFGANDSPEGLGRGYTLGFVVTFVDAEARDAYLPHPEHRRVVPLVDAVAREVLVFDLPG